MEISRGPRTPSPKKTNTTECLDLVQSYLGPRTGCQKQVKAMNVVRNVAKHPSARQPSRIVHFKLPILECSPYMQYRAFNYYLG